MILPGPDSVFEVIPTMRNTTTAVVLGVKQEQALWSIRLLESCKRAWQAVRVSSIYPRIIYIIHSLPQLKGLFAFQFYLENGLSTPTSRRP